jgi:hydrogenase expression/formation protein HypE
VSEDGGEATGFAVSCPLPHQEDERVLLAHGGGGRLQDELVREVFLEAFGSEVRGAQEDAAQLDLPPGRVAFTTDGFVVTPWDFPGADIGHLAVCGTVNDLAMVGARPAALSLGVILEEGFPLASLRKVVASVRDTARAAGVEVAAGDTKVVDRGKGDGIYLTTSGVGVVPEGVDLGVDRIQPGDAVLVSGDVGRHGAAILSVREGLGFETELVSDAACLHELVAALLESGVAVRCLRDLTRGGLAATLNEWARATGHGLRIDEGAVPVHDAVRGACEVLGLDPLLVACEGRFAVVVAAEDADRAVEVLRGHELGAGAARVGVVGEAPAGRVVARGPLGMDRPLDLPEGEQLPRIC